jgi:hypothetical protein
MLDEVRSGHGLFVTELFEHLISVNGLLVCQTFNYLGGHVTVYISLWVVMLLHTKAQLQSTSKNFIFSV